MSVVRWVAASSWGTVPSFLQAASARRGRVARDPRDPRALRFVYLVTAEPADILVANDEKNNGVSYELGNIAPSRSRQVSGLTSRD
jgi:hypothetical protein